MNVNYDRVCRLCLSSRCELLPIFPTTSSDDSEPPVLASKIKDCVSVQISENDDLPTNVCRKCMDNVNNWHIFKTICERTQNKLQSLINKESNLLEEVKIKNEPLSDEAYDDGVVIDGSYPDIENNGPSHKVQPEGPPILASLGLTPRSDKKYVDPRMDWHRVHAILDMVQEDEVIDSLQSMEECDVIHHSDHDSESESEMNTDSLEDYTDCKNGYMCKNKKILSKNPKSSSVNTIAKIKQAVNLRKRNLITTKHCPQPKSAWQLLFTDDLLELIVSSTNEKITKYSKKASDKTNVNEIRTLIGVLYYHGIMRPTHQKFSDLWNNEYGAPCVRNSMQLERFKFLLRNISFDNEDDDSIVQFDVMKRMRKLFEIFALNCRTSLDVGNLVVIDEVILPVHGPCPFRYNIKKKKLKSGLKLVLLIDPVNFYVTNLDVITDPYFGCDEIALKLVQHLAGTGRTVVMDSWFTSDSLIKKLKDEYKLSSIGAINPKDELVPPIFLSKYRSKKIFINGFLDSDTSLTSYVNHNSKVINVLTNDPNYYKKGHTSHNSVVSLYKKYQSAVEVLDVLMHYYTTMQHSNDWTLTLFFMLLNIASVNAQVIWSSENTNTVVQRRIFIRELAISLMENEKLIPSFSNIDVKRIKFSTFEHVTQFYKNRRRCKYCFRTKKIDRRTKQFCLKCGTFICKEHTVTICTVCVAP
ncbi:unnamed protein product, partial [Brenthis ino]